MENETLYNWVFRYNPINKMWYGVKRDDYSSLFSDTTKKGVFKSTSISTLVELINKTDGDATKIKSLIKNSK